MEKKELKTADIKTLEENRRCPVRKAFYYIVEFLAGPMCSKCFPCAFGSFEAKTRLQNIIDGKGTEDDLIALKRIATNMVEASMCKKGKDSARFLLEWINTDIYKEHIEGRCRDRECIELVEYRIIPERCIMCGACQDVCRSNAIFGEKGKPYLVRSVPFEIRQKKCIKCGECIKVCKTEAIIIVDSKEMVGV